MTTATNKPPLKVEAESMEEVPVPESMLEKGMSLQKAGTQFVTAVTVQKPRNLAKVVAAMELEAQYAGAKFWYKLPFGGGIEGPSIGLAVSLAREWGNCAVTMDVQETDEAFFFTGRFIDLEKGYQLERAFRQRKSPKLGKFDGERTQDIAFQIGQSKTIRNVILNSVPRWLVEKTMAAAKAAVAAGIKPEQLIEERKKIVAVFAQKRVTLEMIERKLGKGMVEWTALDIADLRGDYEALRSGEATVEELFAVDAGGAAAAAPEGPLSGKTISDALIKDTTAPAGADPVAQRQKELDQAKGGAPSASEQEQIRLREIYDSMALKCSKCPPYTFATDDADEMKRHMAEKHANGNGGSKDKPAAQGQKGGDLFGPKK